MKLTTVFAVSAVALGASAQPQLRKDVVLIASTWLEPNGVECYHPFGQDNVIEKDHCMSSLGFRSLHTEFLPQTGAVSIFDATRCAVIGFSDSNCREDGIVIHELGMGNKPDVCMTSVRPVTETELGVGHSYKWVCGNDILFDWDRFASLDIANAPAVASRANAMDKGVKGRVKVWPADNEDCNSPNKRKPESFNHDDCQHFNNGFRSIRATADFHKQEYTHRCALLAYTDHKCKVNPAYVVDLYDTAKLGVCLAVNLKQDDSHLMAGHSVKWICDDLLDEFFNSTSQAKIEDTTSTVIAESVNPTVTTVTVGCTLTSDVRFSTTASSHVTTETSVSTHLATHTHVVTHIQSHTIPFSSTYSVCDVEVSTLY